MRVVSNEQEIKAKVDEIVKNEGVELIEFRIFFSKGKHILRCLIDYPSGGITVGDCAKINKKICFFLKENSLLGEDYIVEVNSPGLNRPLVSEHDFLRVKGKTVSLWLKTFKEEREYLEGEVVEVAKDGFLLKGKDKILKINFAQVRLGKEKVKIGRLRGE